MDNINTEVKIAVVGCGHWGKNLVRNFSELGLLQAVCDANKEHATAIAAKYNVTAQSFTAILASDVAGIVIAAPAVQHYQLTKAALQAGKHVFVEKPLALKVAEAQELCVIAKNANKVLMVGHLLQYHAAFLKLKELVGNGTLGKLQYIYSNRLNLGKFRNEENILWSFAPHDISMILSLVDEMPGSIYATGAAHLNSKIHDVTTTHLTFANGVHAHIFVSWLHPFKEQKLIIVANRGMAVFDDSLDWSEKLKLYPHQVNWLNGMPQPQKADFCNVVLEPQEPLRMECKHFIDCITQQQQPRTNGEEGVRVLQVLDAAQRSLQSLKAENLIENTNNYFAHDSAVIDKDCDIGNNTKIWHFSHILGKTQIGENCVIGQNVMIGPDVKIGDNCKIQNNVSVYKGVTLEKGVFCGPACTFTNVINPRAEIEKKDEFRQTYVEQGVTIGANATIICGNRLGAYSLIGAGAVITKDVKPHAIMVGNPAKQIGWASHAGEKLDKNLVCQREGRKYHINQEGFLVEITATDIETLQSNDNFATNVATLPR